jgi:hypothetical protein
VSQNGWLLSRRGRSSPASARVFDTHRDSISCRFDCSPAAIGCAEKLVHRLTLEQFDCRDYTNPGLQKHYQSLETLALEQDVVRVQIMGLIIVRTD